MDSCWETYQLAEWREIDEDRIEWREGTKRIEAHVTQIAAERLHLTLQLAGGVTVETYEVARSPFVCPDLPR